MKDADISIDFSTPASDISFSRTPGLEISVPDTSFIVGLIEVFLEFQLAAIATAVAAFVLSINIILTLPGFCAVTIGELIFSPTFFGKFSGKLSTLAVSIGIPVAFASRATATACFSSFSFPPPPWTASNLTSPP